MVIAVTMITVWILSGQRQPEVRGGVFDGRLCLWIFRGAPLCWAPTECHNMQGGFPCAQYRGAEGPNTVVIFSHTTTQKGDLQVCRHTEDLKVQSANAKWALEVYQIFDWLLTP